MDKRDVQGIIVYFALSLIFGSGIAVLALIIKENSDRCIFYAGEWNKGDIVRGCIAIALGEVARYFIGGLLV